MSRQNWTFKYAVRHPITIEPPRASGDGSYRKVIIHQVRRLKNNAEESGRNSERTRLSFIERVVKRLDTARTPASAVV